MISTQVKPPRSSLHCQHCGIVLMMTGFYIVIARRNLIKMIIGLDIFKTSVFIL